MPVEVTHDTDFPTEVSRDLSTDSSPCDIHSNIGIDLSDFLITVEMKLQGSKKKKQLWKETDKFSVDTFKKNSILRPFQDHLKRQYKIFNPNHYHDSASTRLKKTKSFFRRVYGLSESDIKRYEDVLVLLINIGKSDTEKNKQTT